MIRPHRPDSAREDGSGPPPKPPKRVPGPQNAARGVRGRPSTAPPGWAVYVDGLNFYAAVRGRPETKWVDFPAPAARLAPHDGTVATVKYFTSQISDKIAEDPGSPRRQRVFIRAVRATGVEVFEGKFKVPDEWRSISSRNGWSQRLRPEPPQAMLSDFSSHFATHDARPWKARVELPQEKFTDVAIASYLLRDFYRGECDHAIVVSNDSDLRPAIGLAVADGHHVGVFSPMGTVSRDLARVASWSRSIRPELVGQCQMPDEVRDPGSSRTLTRPAAWK